MTFSALPGVAFHSQGAFDNNVWQAVEIESALQDFVSSGDSAALFKRLSDQGCEPEDIVTMVAALPGRIGSDYL